MINFLKLNNISSQIVLLIFGILIMLVYSYYFGAEEGGDTARYVNGANNILANTNLEGHQSNHISYIWFLAFIFSLGLGFKTIVIIQCILSIMSSWLMFKAGELIFNKKIAFFSALTWMIIVDLQRWNFYILTDGFANSLLLSTLCLSILTSKKNKWIWLFIPVFFLTILSRPEMSIIIFPVAIYFLFKDRVIGIVLLCFLGLFSYYSINSGAEKYEFVNQWKNGVYLGMGKMDGWPESSEFMSLTPPESITSINSTGTVDFIIQAAMKEPIWMVKITSIKLFWFITNTRPYYSSLHNIFGFIFSATVLLFSIYFALSSVNFQKESALFLMVYFFQLIISVVLLMPTHDARGESRVLGILILISVAGFFKYINKRKLLIS